MPKYSPLLSPDDSLSKFNVFSDNLSVENKSVDSGIQLFGCMTVCSHNRTLVGRGCWCPLLGGDVGVNKFDLKISFKVFREH